jgi:26S proteasome regulatory subunit N7
MPAENLEEQGLAKVPDLELAQLKFEVAQGLGGDKKLLAAIKKDKMAPFYRTVCKDLKWKEDTKLWSEMTAENEKELKVLDEKIADVEANLGESEHRDSLLAKAEYLTKIGDKDAAVEAIRKTMEKTVGLGNRMDLIFHNIRVGLFYMDHALIKANLDKATSMMDEGGDWDRRNRLKVEIEKKSLKNLVKIH